MMNMNSRFAGVSRAARALIGSADPETIATSAAAGVPPISATTDDPAPPTPEKDDDDEVEPQTPDAEPEPVDAPPATAATGDAAIRADERARVATVFASDHAIGRERQAADMLQTSMSAGEITGLLAKAPKGGAAADPMLAALSAATNPALGAGAEKPVTDAKAADTIWDNARAKAAR